MKRTMEHRYFKKGVNFTVLKNNVIIHVKDKFNRIALE